MSAADMKTADLADIYKQVNIGLALYRSRTERAAGRHLNYLANAAEWAAGFQPDGTWPEDRWMWDSLREALRDEGGSVRRANAGGGFTESYLDGDVIRKRQIPPGDHVEDRAANRPSQS